MARGLLGMGAMRAAHWFVAGTMAAGGSWVGCSGGSPGETVIVVGATPAGSAASGSAGSGSSDSGMPSNLAPTGDSGAASLVSPVGGSQDGGSNSSGSHDASSSGSASAGGTGVPCDIATYFAQACTSCHGDPPLASALSGLVTYSDLKATAKEDTTKNEAQLSLARMQNATSPMPPGGVAPAADVTALQNWINAGYPMGSCEGGAAPPAASPPVSVFSGAPAYAQQVGSSSHNAGQDCIGCHEHAGSFTIGGTVYDGSGNAVSGAEVRVVDATSKAFSVYTGSNGTFHSSTSFTAPAHIGVRDATHTADMITALQSGSQPPAPSGGACSGCHCTGTGCTVSAVHLP
jgi:hypothetical protein